MRVLVQRVSRASVTTDNKVAGRIDRGLLLLVGIHESDGAKQVEWMVGKVARLRVFNDADGKMNLSVQDVGGGVLAISQFTLYGDTRKGNRPSYIEAARPETAEPLYDEFCKRLDAELGRNVEKGIFGAHMDVELVNNGPVTLMLESPAP